MQRKERRNKNEMKSWQSRNEVWRCNLRDGINDDDEQQEEDDYKQNEAQGKVLHSPSLGQIHSSLGIQTIS